MSKKSVIVTAVVKSETTGNFLTTFETVGGLGSIYVRTHKQWCNKEHAVGTIFEDVTIVTESQDTPYYAGQQPLEATGLYYKNELVEV